MKEYIQSGMIRRMEYIDGHLGVDRADEYDFQYAPYHVFKECHVFEFVDFVHEHPAEYQHDDGQEYKDDRVVECLGISQPEPCRI
jgi:hypothetical protein